MKKSLKKFKIAAEFAPIHIIFTDINGKIIYANKAVEEVTGYKRQEIIDNNPRLWGGQMPQNFYENLWKTIKKDKKVFTGEIKNKRKSGELYTASARIAPIKNKRGKVIGFVGIEIDITKEKELEKRKDEFISIASHELKTPITSIKAFIQILEKRLNNDIDEKNKYLLSSIHSQTNKLIQLINDLLDVGRIEDGKMIFNMGVFDINKLVKKFVRDFQLTTESHVIKIISHASTLVIGDPNRISQVLSNLLTNAIKYSPKGEKIIIELVEDNSKIIVSVKDYGLGILKEDQDKIFERFYRTAETEKNNSSGFGLGLYISSEIIKRHGGEMWVESKKNKGSRFYFSLKKEN